MSYDERGYRHFTCRVCEREFTSSPEMTEGDRRAEYEQVHGKPFPGHGSVGSVCDDCYPKVVAWARERGLLP